MTETKVGTKLRCGSCGTEFVVIKPPSAPPECCGQPMQEPS
jgi:hypothetical protein